MNANDCDKIQMSIMAQDCAEEALMSSSEIEMHLATCNSCRQEVEQTRILDLQLQRQKRRQYDVELWPAIQRQISSQSNTNARWQPFAAVALLLVTYKVIEMIAANPPVFLFNLVPLVLMFALFAVIKENPFRINSELSMEMKK